VVLEPLSGRALRLRKLDVHLLVQRGILREWNWTEQFSGQPENLKYCNFVADKLDLRKDITFGERAKSARWDERANEWEVTFASGLRARSRYLVTALGPLSAPTMPVVDGIEDFQGESWHTGLCRTARSRSRTSAWP